MACPFLSLPFEIIDHILCLTDPETVSDVSQTSRAFYAYIRDNTSLWRSLFAKYFDLPEDHRQNVDWKSHVQSRIRAKHILFAFYSPRTPTIELENLCRTLIQVVRSASPGPGPSKNIAWLADPDVWCSSPVTYIHPRLIHLPQLQPELRVLECNIVGNVENRFDARAFVYDMRNYHHSNLYGPFISRFSKNEPLQTNYLHLMCLMKVLLNNFHSCRRHPYRRMKRGFKNTRSMMAPPSSVDGDWAGVQGVWMRFLSWMSRRDYREYNVRYTIHWVRKLTRSLHYSGQTGYYRIPTMNSTRVSSTSRGLGNPMCFFKSKCMLRQSIYHPEITRRGGRPSILKESLKAEAQLRLQYLAQSTMRAEM